MLRAFWIFKNIKKFQRFEGVAFWLKNCCMCPEFMTQIEFVNYVRCPPCTTKKSGTCTVQVLYTTCPMFDKQVESSALSTPRIDKQAEFSVLPVLIWKVVKFSALLVPIEDAGRVNDSGRDCVLVYYHCHFLMQVSGMTTIWQQFFCWISTCLWLFTVAQCPDYSNFESSQVHSMHHFISGTRLVFIFMITCSDKMLIYLMLIQELGLQEGRPPFFFYLCRLNQFEIY